MIKAIELVSLFFFGLFVEGFGFLAFVAWLKHRVFKNKLLHIFFGLTALAVWLIIGARLIASLFVPWVMNF